MKKNILSKDFYQDHASQKLVEYIEDHIDSLEEASLYYKFPSLRELDEEPVYPSVTIISPYHGIIIFKCDGLIKRRDDNDVLNLENELDRVENLIFAKLIKSPNTKMKIGKRALAFNLSSTLYLPNYENIDELSDIPCDVANTLTDIKNIFDQIKCEKLDDEIMIEIYSIIDASSAIVKPKERHVDKNDKISKAYIMKKLEEEIARFDDEQKYAALSQLDGPQRIRGLAGSGKTIILCMKAAILHLQNPGKKIMYTFMTKSLYDYIELLITRFYKVLSDGHRPDFDNCIYIKHAWGGDNIKGVYYDCCKRNSVTPIEFKEAAKVAGRSQAFDHVCSVLLEETNGTLEKVYDYVLIDEAQDFKSSFYQVCRAIVKNDCIVWGYDELQNIFAVKIQDTINTFKNKYGAEGINLSELQSNHPDMDNDIVLSRCYRNPKEILITAHALGFGIYNDKLIQTLENNSHWEDLGYTVLEGNCKNGDKMIIERSAKNSPLSISMYQRPEDIIKVYSATEFQDEVNWVCNSIEEAIKIDGLRPDDIVVISLDDRNTKLYFGKISSILLSKGIYSHNLSSNSYQKGFTADECVTLSTVYKAKGNEAAMVFVIGCDVFNESKDSRNMRNKVFTAFTRAKAWLRVSGIDISEQSIFEEINQVINNNFRLKFTYKEAHIIQRDLDEISAKKSKKREMVREFAAKLRKEGFSEEEVKETLKDSSLYSDGSDKE